MTTGAENVRWDLSRFYIGLDDPRCAADIARVEQVMGDFEANYRGALATKLGEAIADLTGIEEMTARIFVFPKLLLAQNTGDTAAQARYAEVQAKIAEVQAKHLAFFEIELANLADEAVESQMGHELVARHRPWIDQKRQFKPYQLTEPEESVLSAWAPYGAQSWANFFREVQADLRFPWKNEDGEEVQLSLGAMLKFLTHQDADVRARALHLVNEGFGGYFAKFSANALYDVVASKRVSDKRRGYKHPMQFRNMENLIPDEVVEALHQAVRTRGAELSREYYRLKAELMGLPRLKWSDRLAPMPFAEDAPITWDEAVEMVQGAYAGFSPTLARLTRGFLDEGYVDAADTEGRENGAFNMSAVFPGNQSMAYTFMTFRGVVDDVSTLAHELGHGVHGILAGEAQGPLMSETPLAICETASVFGENLVFQRQYEMARAKGPEAALSLVMGKVDDMLSTVVRQISFSDFERVVHGHDGENLGFVGIRKWSVEDLDGLWLRVTVPYYGEPGDIFDYDDFGHQWSYVSHFHRPFYVYAYACGELLTHSLYALRDKIDGFEELYLNFLRCGGSKSIVELLKPFGIDPRDPSFWLAGIEVSLGKYMKLAKELAAEIKTAA